VSAPAARAGVALGGLRPQVPGLSFAAALPGGGLLLGGRGGELRVYRAGSPEPAQRRRLEGGLEDAAWLAGRQELVVLRPGGALERYTWSQAEGLGEEPEAIRVPGEVRCLAPAGAGRLLLGLEDGRAGWVDLEAPGVLRAAVTLGGAVSRVAATPEGELLAATDRVGLRVWRADSGESRLQLTGPVAPHYPRGRLALALDPQGRRAFLFLGDRGELRSWVLGEGPREPRLAAYLGGAGTLLVEPGGEHLLLGAQSRVHRVEAAGLEDVQVLDGGAPWQTPLALHGGELLVGFKDRFLARWRLADGDRLDPEPGHPGEVRAVALSPAGTRAVTGSDEGDLCWWDAHSGVLERRLEKVGGFGFEALEVAEDGEVRVRAWGTWLRIPLAGDPEPAEAPAVRGVASPAGLRRANLDYVGSIRIEEEGVELARFETPGGRVEAAAFHPSGRAVLSVDGDRRLRLWGLVAARLLEERELDEAVWPARGRRRPGLLVSPRGDALVVLAEGDDLLLLGLEEVRRGGAGAELRLGWERRLRPHQDVVSAAAFSEDGAWLITGSPDGTARVQAVGPGGRARGGEALP